MIDDKEPRPGPMYPPLHAWDIEPHYCAHVAAMTTEGLHDKAAIAEQLAWRDQQIEALRADRVHLEEAARLLRAGESGFGDEGIDFRTRQHGDRLHAWLERERLRLSKQGEGT